MKKFRNKKVEVDGHLFDSKMEYDYYLYLKEEQEAGRVKRIELQPAFVLIPAFRKDDKSFRKAMYFADFRIAYIDGTEHVVDVKGFETDTFRLKRKLLEYQSPNIAFFLVKRTKSGWVKKERQGIGLGF